MWIQRSVTSSIAAALGVLMAFTGGIAQAALEEVVVTAQRREQNLQEVGISVTAFSDEQVRNMGFGNTVDVAQMTPNLNYTVPQGGIQHDQLLPARRRPQ